MKLNAWPIRRFILLILSIQIALWGLIGLDALGIEIPILQQLIGLIYLLIIPGLIIIKILKLNNISLPETLVISVGLSIATLMALGFTIGFLLPFFGVATPITKYVITISISLLVILLILFAIVTKTPYQKINFSNTTIENVIPPQVLGLLLLPLTAVVGAFLMNYYEKNTILFFLIFIIALIPILISFNKIGPEHYPICILMVSLSLLLHRSLISQYLWGSDVFEEYYYAKQILDNGYWDINIDWNLNAILSVTLLPGIFTNICNLDLIWVFKIVYPLIYSLVPLIIFIVLKDQTNEKIAFYSVFFYMSVAEFFGVNIVLLRQEIGLLFVALLILVLFTNNIERKKISILLLIFGFSLIVSHYALIYIFLFCIGSTLIFIWLNDNMIPLIFKDSIDGSGINDEKGKYIGVTPKIGTFRPLIVLFLFFMTIIWYSYNADGSGFISIVNILDLAFQNMISEFLNPGATEGLAMLGVKTSSILYLVLKYLFIFSQACISIGILFIIAKKLISNIYFKSCSRFISKLFIFEEHFAKEYIYISLSMFSILIAGILLPYFSGNLGSMRLFHISLIVLSPYFVLGFFVVLQILNISAIFKSCDLSICYIIISAFLTVFLLFNSGFIHEVLKDENPSSISLSNDHLYKKSSLYDQMEFASAEFLIKGENNATVYSDVFGRQILRAYIFPKTRIIMIRESDTSLTEGTFVYLRVINCEGYITVLPTKKLETVERPYKTMRIDNSLYKWALFLRNKIYTNHFSQVLL